MATVRAELVFEMSAQSAHLVLNRWSSHPRAHHDTVKTCAINFWIGGVDIMDIML